MAPRRGLIVGKFAPLHKGHQLVIETALQEMDEVLVLIYDCPETTPVPLSVRANWIRKLYPAVNVVECRDGPTEVGNSVDIKRKHEDYVLNRLKITGISHFYSSEFYGEHMSEALGAVNRLVDPQRTTIPVSATSIRKQPFELRHQLDPIVYRDLVTKVVLLGAPSTGKTTLARRLAEELETVWMPEYGREYWENNQSNRRLSLRQLEEIAEEHIRREEYLLSDARDFLFSDTNALTTRLFALEYHNSSTAKLDELADQSRERYDLVFLCDSDIPYDDTWDRSGDVSRQSFQAKIREDLEARKILFITLSGDLDRRIGEARLVLQKHSKYEQPLQC